MGAAPIALGRAPWPIASNTGHRAAPDELAPQTNVGRSPVKFRYIALPLSDGVAVTIVALVVTPKWQAVAYGLLVLVVLNASGAQRLRICLRVSDEIPRLAASAAAPVVLLVPWTHPAGRLAGLSIASFGLFLGMRVGLYRLLRACYRRDRLIERTVIIGGGRTGSEVAKAMRDHPELGLRPVGFVGTQQQPAEPLPLLGDLPEIAISIRQWSINTIIVCFTDSTDADLVTVLRASPRLRRDVYVVPRMYELAAAIPPASRDDLWGIPLIPLRPCWIRWSGLAAKRAFDVVAGTALLIAFAPLLVLLLILVPLSYGRPVFFRQVRVSRFGDLITITKFRTITVPNPDAQWTVSPDHCPRLGRWLRLTHLDELPQLFNVMRGQMSLVGPRPERPVFSSQFAEVIPRYEDRHRVRSGMTGWAQVHGLNGDTSIAERVRFDNYYIENWSLWTDVTILARTLAQPLIGALDRLRSRRA